MYLHTRAIELLYKRNITLVDVRYGCISAHCDYLRHPACGLVPPAESQLCRYTAISESESEWALLARYVYTYEEFVIVTKLHSATEWQQRDRTQTTKEQYTNIQIGNVQNSKNTMQYRQSCVYRSDVQIWNGKKLNKKYYICMFGE